MLSCCDTGRSKEHKAKKYVALALITALLWVAPGMTLTFSTVSECDRTFNISHLCAYEQMGVRNRRQKMERKAWAEGRGKEQSELPTILLFLLISSLPPAFL